MILLTIFILKVKKCQNFYDFIIFLHLIEIQEFMMFIVSKNYFNSHFFKFLNLKIDYYLHVNQGLNYFKEAQHLNLNFYLLENYLNYYLTSIDCYYYYF